MKKSVTSSHNVSVFPITRLGYRFTNADPDGRYTIVKEIITDPHLGCILQHTQLTGDEAFISTIAPLCAVCASSSSRRME